MANDKILVIEDEKDLAKLLRYNLEQQNYRVVSTADGESGLSLFRKEKPDLVILDIMLPNMDGFELCRLLRQESRVPLLMLTAKKEEMDRVLGLELGADDYVTKPFSVRELLARIKTILRRTRSEPDKEAAVRYGDLAVDFDRYTVTVKSKRIAVSSKEFEFLKTLIQAKGKALTREHLLEQVWGLDQSMNIDTRTIDQHIARLRDKLGPEAKRVVTVKNVGYRFETQ